MSQQIMEVKFTARTGNSGVVVSVPIDEVENVLQPLLGRNGLKRITIEWPEEPAHPTAPRPAIDGEMLSSIDEISDLINEQLTSHDQDVLLKARTIIDERIKTAMAELPESNKPEIESGKTVTIEVDIDAAESERAKVDDAESTISVEDPRVDTVQQQEITEPPEPLESQSARITPFKEIDRISYKELKELRSTNNPRLKFFAMGDGRIVLDYANSKVYTTWVAIKSLPDEVPDEMQGELNQQKWHAVKAFKAWMVWRKEQQAES